MVSFKHGGLTDRIIGAFFHVYNTLGTGFLEKVYENALVHELGKRGMAAAQQVPIPVYYDGILVGQYFADILVDNAIILELKAAEAISSEHQAQLVNYLKATAIDVGLILNFGPEPTFCRRIYETARKAHRPPRTPPHT